MTPQVYGFEHITYIIVSTVLCAAALVLMKLFAKTEKQKTVALRVLAFLLLVAIVTNRLSQVFRYEETRWYCIIPDSFCGLTSLMLALAALFGRKDNNVYHFLWLLSIFGGISTVVYPTFVSQNMSFFYIPTISGLVHHSLSATTAIALLLLGQLNITYKKWYCVILGFTCYFSVGAFQMSVFGMSDAFHIVEPIFSGTFLTAWGMAPIYVAVHGAIFGVIELVRHRKRAKKDAVATV